MYLHYTTDHDGEYLRFLQTNQIIDQIQQNAKNRLDVSTYFEIYHNQLNFIDESFRFAYDRYSNDELTNLLNETITLVKEMLDDTQQN